MRAGAGAAERGKHVLGAAALIMELEFMAAAAPVVLPSAEYPDRRRRSGRSSENRAAAAAIAPLALGGVFMTGHSPT